MLKISHFICHISNIICETAYILCQISNSVLGDKSAFEFWAAIFKTHRFFFPNLVFSVACGEALVLKSVYRPLDNLIAR